jgi:hypothetical protein
VESAKTANAQNPKIQKPLTYITSSQSVNPYAKMPPRVPLEPHKEEIRALFESGITQQEILNQFNTQQVVRHQPVIKLRTLQTQLQAWGFSHRINLDDFIEDIFEAFEAGETHSDILYRVNTALSVRRQPPISERSLRSQFTAWGLFRKLQVPEETVNRVRFYFYQYGYSDQSIIRDLKYQDEIQLSPFQVKKIRLDNGMKRRFRTTEERTEALRKAIDFLETDLRRTQAIRGFGRGYLWNYVRQKAGILISQNRLYDFYQDVFPEEVQKRREGNFKHRTDFSVPGPNFLWCLDGYEKLKRFGFQIYACIDAYSRCIIWFFIGRSATTAISTLKQFLRTIKHLRMRPFFTRSDHGVETPLWVAAQATLAQCGPAEITYEDADGVTHRYRQGDRIQSCHMYGPSTRNVRIESWWRSLRGGASDRWIVSWPMAYEIPTNISSPSLLSLHLRHTSLKVTWLTRLLCTQSTHRRFKMSLQTLLTYGMVTESVRKRIAPMLSQVVQWISIIHEKSAIGAFLLMAREKDLILKLCIRCLHRLKISILITSSPLIPSIGASHGYSTLGSMGTNPSRGTQ